MNEREIKLKLAQTAAELNNRKTKQLEETVTTQGAEIDKLKAESTKLIDLAENIEAMHKNLQAAIDKMPNSDEVPQGLTDLNNNVKTMHEILQAGLKVTNQVDAVAVKNLDDIKFPDQLEITNMVQMPDDLATNKAIAGLSKSFGDAIMPLVDALQKAAKDKPIQTASYFMPFRRVVKDGNAFVFDDTRSGGGYAGGGGSSVQPALTRNSGVAIAVVNPDGSNISGGGGGGGGGDASAANQVIGNASLASIDGKVASEDKQDDQITVLESIDAGIDEVTAAVEAIPAGLTDTQLRATAVPVSVSGVATASKQDTGNTSIASIDTKTPTVGQKTMAASRPVVLASDQASIPITVATIPSHAVTNAGTFAVQNNSHSKTVLSTGGAASSSGNNTLVAAGTNRLKVKAFSLTTTSTTAVTCIFQSGAGGAELWRVVLQAPTGVSVGANLAVPAPDWLFATASATLLNLNLSSAQTVHWSVSYYDEA